MEVVSFSRELPAWELALGLSLGSAVQRGCLKPQNLSESLLPCEKKPLKTIAVTASGGVKSNAILCAKVICKQQTHELFFSPSAFVVRMDPERLLCSGGLNSTFWGAPGCRESLQCPAVSASAPSAFLAQFLP